MKTFADYYRDLLEWESVEFQELITNWETDLIKEIESDFENAVKKSAIKNLICPIRENSSNQSIGNQVETFIIEKLTQSLEVFTVENCSGAGYPDRILAKGSFKQIALEMKATSDWNPNDSNRRVLTSSSRKLREKFNPPIFHLICTTIYLIEEKCAKIKAIRLDFIEPTTQVNVRLEASVNHRILANGEHQSIVFE